MKKQKIAEKTPRKPIVYYKRDARGGYIRYEAENKPPDANKIIKICFAGGVLAVALISIAAAALVGITLSLLMIASRM